MEITVSHLIHRMALTVPDELPLGLVFVAGEVADLAPDPHHDHYMQFYLIDGEHRLQCQIAATIVAETRVAPGDQVRLSGRLIFDDRVAHYSLIAGDLEVKSPPRRIPQGEPRAIASESVGAEFVGSDLPPWVMELAPPEVQQELEMSQTVERARAERVEELPEEMVAFLSQAIDSNELIEVDAEVIDEYWARAGDDASPNKRRGASKHARAKTKKKSNQQTLSPTDSQLEAILLLLLLLLIAMAVVITVIVLS